MATSTVRCFGSSLFRFRIVCSLLTGRKVVISDIRTTGTEDNPTPGVRDFEANFLRLIDKITNGTEIAINETGTRVSFKPGFLVGGTIAHDCGKSRSIGYFLEALIYLAPFGKSPLNITLEGITNDENDNSVDLIRTVTLPLLKNFGIEDDIELKTLKRGAPPNGGGQVRFSCPIVKMLNPIQLLDEGKVRRIRGIAYSTRMSPQTSNRVIEAARSILNHYQPDVFIYSDHFKGAESGLSPGFALALVAETTTGCAYSAEVVAQERTLPEDLGKQAAKLLITEVQNGGCVDSSNQTTVLLFMTLCPDSISQVRLGKLSPYTISCLRAIKEFFGVTFSIEGFEDEETEAKSVVCTCRGIGFKNLAKKVY